MFYCKKYTSVFLLLVFTWVLLPPAFLHYAFADHHDTVCDFKHRHDVTTVESLHTHCAIFTTNTPLYYAPRLAVFAVPARILIAELGTVIHFRYLLFARILLPARAPPVL